jgi:preprotein translocase subunit SecG
MNIWGYITIGSSILLTILVLVQTRGASLGAGLGGGGGDVNMVRRGSDKTIFNMTIVVAVVFGVSLLIGLLTA